MKRRIFPLLLALAVGVTSLTAAAADWTPKQQAVHEIAEQARALGLAEDNPIIVEASRLWWEEENAADETVDETADETGPLLVYYGSCYVTGYCGDGKTASGTKPTVGRTCATAVSSKGGLPFGTKVYIEGLGTYTVEDRGGGNSRWFDVYCGSRSECYAITGNYDVWIVEG